MQCFSVLARPLLPSLTSVHRGAMPVGEQSEHSPPRIETCPSHHLHSVPFTPLVLSCLCAHMLALKDTACPCLLILMESSKCSDVFFLITKVTHVHRYRKVKYYRNACSLKTCHSTPQNPAQTLLLF